MGPARNFLENGKIENFSDKFLIMKIFLEIEPLKDKDKVLDYGSLGNFSLSGFEMVLTRYVSTYIITYYLPSGQYTASFSSLSDNTFI